MIFGDVPDGTAEKISGTRNNADWVIFLLLYNLEFVKDGLVVRNRTARKRF